MPSTTKGSKTAIGLNSANSINISRLLALGLLLLQRRWPSCLKADRAKAVISVPSGNFGNLTAGLIAKALGLPVKRFIAATNANDTVPRYRKPAAGAAQTVATLSNAMDVSRPTTGRGWKSCATAAKAGRWNLLGLACAAMPRLAMPCKRLRQLDYLCEPRRHRLGSAE